MSLAELLSALGIGLGSFQSSGFAQDKASRPPGVIRVMTYNIHSCKGRDGMIRPDRIAKVIALYSPDIVALQEVRVGRVEPRDVDRPGSEGGGLMPPAVGERPLPPASIVAPRKPSETPGKPVPFTDQPRAIADAVGMYSVFYPLVRLATEDYGIAVLSKYPLRLIRAENLPTLARREAVERRGAIWVEADVDGRPVQILDTHLGLNQEERMAQVDALLGPDWLGSPKMTAPYVLCGDFNARPSNPVYDRLSGAAVDVVTTGDGLKARRTWPSPFPIFRIDHVFVSTGTTALDIEVPRTELTRAASDHLPVVVDLVLPNP